MRSLPPLYVLRHGETEWNRTGRLQGSFDSALTDLGKAQARAQSDLLKSVSLQGFMALSSPQGRALETARIALEGHEIVVHTADDLREIGLGDWAGLARQPLIDAHALQDGFDIYERAPGGEGFAALHSRCAQFLAGLDSPTILVTHGITSRMIRLIATGRPVCDLRAIGGGQGVVFHVMDGVQKRLRLGA